MAILGVNFRKRLQRIRELVRLSQTKQQRFTPVWSEQLQADRQSIAGNGARDADAGDAGQTFLQQQTAGAVLVFQVSVAGGTGEQDNFFVGGVSGESGENNRRESCEKEFSHRTWARGDYCALRL